VELASVCARAAVCSFDEAIERLPTLLELGILRRNGTIAKKVKAELDRRGARRVNAEVENVPEASADGEDEDEEEDG
jgi:L-asparaginase/Glu-tRNA(Gln) amidotransferase subunit D